MEKNQGVNPNKKKFDKDSTDSLSTKESWIKEMDDEFKKKADYIIKNNLFDPAYLTYLTESGLSLIIHQVQVEPSDDGKYSWAIGCMSHGKHLQTEQVQREFVVKILRYFADSIENGGGYFSDKKLEE